VRWPRATQAPHGLTIHSERTGRAHLLQPVGELIVDTVRQFEDELKRVEASDAPEICIDLSRVEWVDRSGLKLFIHASARWRERAGGLRLVRGPDAVQRAFRTSGLESRLPFADRPERSPTDRPRQT
jgi:anti-anti-sigma factor